MYMEQETNPQTINHIDYKDVVRLKNHVNPHARMHSRRRTGMTAKQQRDFARAIKRARFMALMPYVSH
jgi:small subunit ribosomal protein S18